MPAQTLLEMAVKAVLERAAADVLTQLLAQLQAHHFSEAAQADKEQVPEEEEAAAQQWEAIFLLKR